jgi:SAM-dependent methyltransferase
MRPIVKAEGLVEHLALWGNLGPVPVAEVMFGMGMSRALMAGVRLGLFAALSNGDATAETIADVRRLDAVGATHLLDCLCVLGHVQRSRANYRISPRARRWLDPASPTYIGDFIEFNYDQWEWWSRMEEAVASGKSFEIHDYGPDDPRWERYIRAMFQLARLSAPEVVNRIPLSPESKNVIDVGGGHGWFAAEICKRNEGLRATVLDLPGSVRVGRKIIEEAGLSDRVEHVEGDILTSDLGGPYDGALLFQIIHHLSPEQNVALLQRIREALSPGGVVAVLDYFRPPKEQRPDASAFLGLHFYLTSSSSTYAEGDLEGWMTEAGFRKPEKMRIRRLPAQLLFVATRE